MTYTFNTEGSLVDGLGGEGCPINSPDLLHNLRAMNDLQRAKMWGAYQTKYRPTDSSLHPAHSLGLFLSNVDMELSRAATARREGAHLLSPGGELLPTPPRIGSSAPVDDLELRPVPFTYYNGELPSG